MPSDPAAPCARCRTPLESQALVCGSCHALIHQDALEALSASAQAEEARGELAAASSSWARALALLPHDSTQAEWIRRHQTELDARAGLALRKGERGAWARRFGPLAPVLLLLAKGKFLLTLLKLKFLLSFVAFAGLYWALYGIKFGIGIALLVLVHELGHFVEVKRRGLPADLPVFVPGLGAYVRWQATGISAKGRALVSLAGPCAGALAAALCALLWVYQGSRFWLGLASFSALLNLMNLIPLSILDGGQAMAALDKGERIALSVVAVLCFVVYSQPMFILVAAGAVYRLFTKDLPADAGRGVMAYYVALLVALGYLMQLAPLDALSRPAS